MILHNDPAFREPGVSLTLSLLPVWLGAWFIVGCTTTSPKSEIFGKLPERLDRLLIMEPLLAEHPVVPGDKLPAVQTAWREAAISFMKEAEGRPITLLAESQAEYESAQAQLMAALGLRGFYEEGTGRFDKALFEQFAQKLATKLGAKFYLILNIVQRMTMIKKEYAQWDGTYQCLRWLDICLPDNPTSSNSYNGPVMVLSLRAALHDSDGRLLWIGRGGHSLLVELVFPKPSQTDIDWDDVYPLEKLSKIEQTVERTLSALFSGNGIEGQKSSATAIGVVPARRGIDQLPAPARANKSAPGQALHPASQVSPQDPDMVQPSPPTEPKPSARAQTTAESEEEDETLLDVSLPDLFEIDESSEDEAEE